MFGGGLNWGAGVVTGLSFILFWQERVNPPAWIAQWQAGSWGEELTAEALRPLEEEGWHVLHDLRTRAGTTVDHVLVGPGGVFLLDSKATGGTVAADGTRATVTRPRTHIRYRHDFGRQMRAQARDVHQRLLAGTRARQWVTPVVVSVQAGHPFL